MRCLCGHYEDDHSQVLTDSPCLDCDCPALMVQRPPNPSIVSGFRCPLCGGMTEGYGTERRRIGRRPWKRRVHTRCMDGPSLRAVARYPDDGVTYRGGKQPPNPPPIPTAQKHPPAPPVAHRPKGGAG